MTTLQYRLHGEEVREGPVLLGAVSERWFVHEYGDERLDDVPLCVRGWVDGRALRTIGRRRVLRVQPLPQWDLRGADRWRCRRPRLPMLLPAR